MKRRKQLALEIEVTELLLEAARKQAKMYGKKLLQLKKELWKVQEEL